VILTGWTGVILAKPVVALLVNKFAPFYRNEAVLLQLSCRVVRIVTLFVRSTETLPK
jgi:hypothetical protein